jgi:hypothetical protein
MSKKSSLLLSLVLCLAPAALHAQALSGAEPAAHENSAAPTLRDQLMPTGAALQVSAPVVQVESKEAAAKPAAMASHGGGTAYMLVGGALFAAGIIAGGGAGTVLLLAGAGIGAYGIYLHFM